MLFISLMLVLFAVLVAAGFYIDHLHHREVMAARRAPPPGVLHLARQVEDLEERLERVERNRRVVPQ